VPHIVVACLAALAAATLYAAAVTLQALEARRAPADLHLRASLIVFLFRRRLWVLGTALGLLGWPLQALALAFAPLALVQPIMALSVVGLLAAGHRILGEPITRRSALATLAIVGGIAILAVTVPRGGGSGNGGLLAVALAGLGVLAVAPLLPLPGRPAPANRLAFAAGAAYVLVALTTALLDSALGRGAWWPAVAWIALSAASAGVGGITEMSAFRLAPATVVAPMIFAMETVAPALLGPLLGQRLGSGAPSLAIDLGGLVLVGLGVILLARSRSVADLVGARG
jgi:drug/metabolite transporter (DMT)-like permease